MEHGVADVNVLGRDKKGIGSSFFSEIKGPVAVRQRIKALHFPLEFFKQESKIPFLGGHRAEMV